jgi:NADH-quinone oxidoreductase subunit M
MTSQGFLETHLLSILIFAPLAAAAVSAVLRSEQAQRIWALVATTALAALSIGLWCRFDASTHAFQFVENYSWIPSLKINYAVGLDGISVLLVLLTTLITPLCVLASWTYIKKRVKEFMIALLVMEAAMVGVFSALDTVLFFTFWEAMLIPMSLMIGVWGGPRRIYASLKFFIYTMAGSIFLLVSIIAIRMQTGSFGIQEAMGHPFSHGFQLWIFAAFFLSFAIKVPMFPFHTWLPAAHVEAPTAGSVILASVLLKMGTYGFLRFCLPMAPYATQVLAPYIIWASVIAVIYGGFTALAQGDMKKLVAYSSVAHMGFAVMGIFSLNQQGLEGATLVMINHGITTGALFIMVGILYERLHTRELDKLAGLGAKIPVFTGFFGVFCLSSLAFPGTNSFVGEFLVLAGGFKASPWAVVCVVPGVIAAAAYMYRVLQKFAYGSAENPEHHEVADLSLREIITLAPLLFGVFWVGLHPQPLLNVMKASLAHVLEQAHRHL